VVDTERILAHDERRDVVDRACNRERLESEGGLAPAEETTFVGVHADEDEVATSVLGDFRRDGLDPHLAAAADWLRPLDRLKRVPHRPMAFVDTLM
jgi:hypothetical protein